MPISLDEPLHKRGQSWNKPVLRIRAGPCTHVKQLLCCLKDSEKKQNLGSEGKRNLLKRDQIIQNASSHLTEKADARSTASARAALLSPPGTAAVPSDTHPKPQVSPPARLLSNLHNIPFILQFSSLRNGESAATLAWKRASSWPAARA